MSVTIPNIPPPVGSTAGDRLAGPLRSERRACRRWLASLV